MKKLSLSALGKWRWMIVIVSVVALMGATAFTLTGNGDAAFAKSSHHGHHGGSKQTVKVWVQATDSCMQALSGATFTVAGPGVNTTTAPTTGSTPKGLPGYMHQCPIQQGTCVNFSTGCTSTTLDVPSSGSATYTITVAKTAPGQGTNLSYAICEGGSDCPHGPEVATVKVSSSSAISATVLNFYPDGVTVTWPTNKSAYSGSQSDPIMFHEYGIGNGSLTCDGDHDADDFLTGSRFPHCDSDSD